MQIDHASGQPYYVQIVEGIEQDVVRGVLRVGDQLPSVREMARQHLLNPNTVSKAYKQLETQQVIRTVPGKGTYVNALNAASVRSELQKKLQQIVSQAQQAGISFNELHGWLDQMEGTTL